MKKILHIITRMDMGGSAQNTLLTCQGLDPEKYRVILAFGLSRESRMTEAEENTVAEGLNMAAERGVRIVRISALVRKIDPIRDIRALYSLWQMIRKERPDIVHTHSSKAGILGRLAARLAGVPRVIHTPHGHVFHGHFGPAASRLFFRLEKAFAGFTDIMVALTEGERTDYILRSLCEPEKLVTIHSGVDIDKYLSARVDVNRKKKRLGIKTGGWIVGTVGWLLPIKGPVHLLNAMKHVWEEYPDTVLVYVGKGDLEDQLREMTVSMNADDKTVFTGWRNDVHEIMRVLDIFVLPSLNEGMGRVLVEAMSAGCAIVASRIGGIPDLVFHEENGLLVSPGDEEGIARAIIRLIKNPDESDAFRQKGKKMCHQFSVQAMTQKIEALYETP